MIKVSTQKILFIGDLTLGHCARSLVEGFLPLNLEIRSLDTSTYMRNQSLGSREWVQRKIFKRPSSEWVNEFKNRLYELTSNWKPDILFCINTIHIPQEILLGVKCGLRAHLSYDDVSNADNLTSDYLEYEFNWDVIFTNKSYNVDELKLRTNSKVSYFANAYNPVIHRLTMPLDSRKWDLGFIGARREDRKNLPRVFSSLGSTKSVIAGPRWRRSYPFGIQGVTFLPEVLNTEYTSLGNQIKAGICLLNSSNRDEITTRSFELPALGQLVIGKKTREHESLLENEVEAFWFDSTAEMISFASDILKDPREALRVSLAGNRRITSGKNTYMDRAEVMLKSLIQD